jgi:hypothetical protein
MYEFLYAVGEYLLLLNMVALFISALVFPQRSAFVSILLLVVALQLLHMWYQPYLMNNLAKRLSKEDIRTLWYMGFAVTDFLLVWLAVSYCSIKNMARDKVSNFILGIIAVLGVIQMVRYADRVFIGTDALGGVYKAAIPALNFSVSFMAIAYVSYFSGAGVLNFILKRTKEEDQ